MIGYYLNSTIRIKSGASRMKRSGNKEQREMRKPDQNQLQKIVNDFNAKYPVGTKVILRKDSGEVETQVTAPARILSGHSAVAWFEGVSGAYSVNGRVRPAA